MTPVALGGGAQPAAGGQITLDMNGYKDDLVARHGFADAHSAPGPGKANIILSERDCVDPDTEGAPDQQAYRSRVGGLLWLCRGAHTMHAR